MKPIHIIYTSFWMTVLLAASSCKKESPNIFNMFSDVSVTLDSTSLPHSLGFYNQINDGDNVVFNFTVESAKTDIYQVSIYQVGSAIPFLNIPVTDASQRRKFSYTYEMGPFTGMVGINTYRIFVYDSAGIYIGDGYKTITLDVAPNYTFLPNRKLYYPDSTTGNLNCYLSLLKGGTYNYPDGALNSGDIDLGLYKTVTVASNGTITTNSFIYSLSAPNLPFDIYDISTWTKRETKFSSPQNGQASNFVRNYTSGNKIETYAKGRKPTSTSVTSSLVAGSAVAFLTPEGNYGILLVNSITQDSDGRPYMDVSIKYKN